ncbi:MAG: PD40 domain-containing protein [Brasilonema octagenarum HA4186-MV1]|jgi:WD40 repeat protein/energy-coupling factor transporter ATP-binding protein EcfA2|nr:PD40 domain-containing protein [Brasilonema octagenarum HA4186-MV1]
MNTFEITIQRKSGDSWPIVVEHTQPGVLLPLRLEGNLCLSTEDLQHLTSLQGQVRDYGRFLGKALLRDEVRDGFVRALSQNQQTVRVLLFIEAIDKQLRTLRWERLCAPIDGEWQILALNQRVPFSFYIPAITDRLFPAIGRRDLKALVLVASPSDSIRYKLDIFDVEATVKSVRVALGDIPTDVLATVDGAIGLPTLDELCAQLTDRTKQYTMLHFVSHGKVMDDGETLLYWSKSDNTVEVVTATKLIERVRQLRGARGLPHFTFLCTCESASPEAEGALGGLGQRLVRDLGMPAVVAMTEKVTIKTAQALTEKFYYQLRQSGEVDSALHEATATLAERGDVTVPALFSRLGGRPLFSDQLDRELTNAEIQYGLERLVQLLPERSPVLEKKFAPIAHQLKNTLGADAVALSKEALKEREQTLEEVNNLCEEILDLNFNALALDQQPPIYDSRCPFLGLYPFRIENREFFFGREELIAQLQQKLTEHNFLAVLGGSGSGKSSLVLAGLIPKLQEKQTGLVSVYMTPSSNPIEQLETSLETIAQSSILVIDQFEELFTLCTDEAQRLSFIEKLLSLIPHQKVVITMRADFWGECAPYRNLKDLMEARQKLIGPMDAAQLRKAMEMQAAKVGLRFEAGLSNLILDNVQGEPGAMPLLQHALLEMWKHRHGRWLRTVEYEAIGGVNKAIAQTADDVYNSLLPAEQDQVKNIFIRLTRLDENALQGEKRRDTRQRVWLDELVPAGGDLATTKRLVQRLAGEGARLVVTSVDGSTNREEVEIAHEALIRHWPRLLQWLDDNRINLQVRKNIRDAALDWEKQQKSEDYLTHDEGGRLKEAQELAKNTSFLNKLETEYVSACTEKSDRQEREKEARRRREIRTAWGIAGGSLIALILTAGLGILSFHRKQQAEITKAEALGRYSLSLSGYHQDVEALVEGIRAGKILQGQKVTQPLVLEALQQVIDRVRERNNLTGHNKSVNSVVFSPDGKTFASASDDGTVKLWDLNGKELQTFRHQKEYVQSVIFSPDGKTVATAATNISPDTIGEEPTIKTIKLWDLNGKELQTFKRDQENIITFAFSANGKTLATAHIDSTLKLWDLNGRELKKIKSEEFSSNIVFSPDGKTLATTDYRDHTVKLWDFNGKQLQTFKGHKEPIISIAFSLNGKTLATTDENETKVWNLNGKELHSFSNEKPALRKIFFSHNGKTLAIVREDNTIQLSDLGGQELAIFKGHQANVTSVAFSPDGKTLASASLDSTIKLWDLKDKQPQTFKRIAMNEPIYIPIVALSPDGKTLATDLHGTIELLNLNGEKLPFQTKKGGFVTTVIFSPDGKTLASASQDNTLKLWDLNGKELRTLPSERYANTRHQGKITSIVFSPDGKTLVSASVDKTVKLWDLNTNESRTLKAHKGNVNSVAFSPDGKTLASASVDETVKLWDLNGNQLQTFRGHQGNVNSVAFSPDGKTLASASEDETVKLWDLNGKELRTLPSERNANEGHKGNVNSVAFSPDGKTLASASKDKTVKLWDLNGKELQTLKNEEGVDEKGVASVIFNPDGKTLVTTVNYAIIVWDLDKFALDPLLDSACDWTRNYLKNSQEVQEEDRHLCDGIGTNQ